MLRRYYRQDGKVKDETLAKLSHLALATIGLIRQSLTSRAQFVTDEGFEIERSLPHGHVAAILVMANKLKFATLLGPACKERDLVLALVIARVARSGFKLVTSR